MPHYAEKRLTIFYFVDKVLTWFQITKQEFCFVENKQYLHLNNWSVVYEYYTYHWYVLSMCNLHYPYKNFTTRNKSMFHFYDIL